MIPHPLTELFSTVVSVSWRAGWLILVLAVLRLAVRGRMPAQVWFAAWILVAVRLVLPFSVPTGWSPYNLAAAQPPATTSAPRALPPIVNATTEPAPAVTATNIPQPQISLEGVNAVTAPVATNAVAQPWSRTEMLAAVWLAGVAVLTLARLAGSWNFRRRLRDARPVAEGRVAALVASERQRAGGRGRLVVEETGAVEAPALYGLVRPRLLLPPDLAAKLSDEEFRHVVRHELGHWRRRDLLAQELMQAAVALHWFNPLAWLAARLARADCELACDEFVLGREGPGGATAYGATLLKVLGVVRRRRRPVAVVAMLEGREQLAQRIRMIAGYRAATMARVVGGVALIAMLTVASLTRETRAADKAGAPSAPSSVASGNVAAPASSTQEVTGTDETTALAQESGTAKAFADLAAVIYPQKRKVDQLARDLQAYKEKHNLDSLDTRRDIATDTMKALNRQLHEAATVLAAAEVRLNQLKEYRARDADLRDLPFIGNQPLVTALTQQQAAAKIAVGTLRQRFGDKHPDVINAANNLAEIEKELQRAVDSASRQVEADADLARRNWESAQDGIARAKAEAIALDREALPYSSLERELRTQEQILQSLAARAREVSSMSGNAREIRAAPANGEIENQGIPMQTADAIPYLQEQAGRLKLAADDAQREFQSYLATHGDQNTTASEAGTVEIARLKSRAASTASQYAAVENRLRETEQQAALEKTSASTRRESAQAGADLAKDRPAANGTVTISIDQNGVVSVNGRSATNDQLPGLLKEAHDIDKDVPVLIQASETTPLQKLAFVMEACRKAGLNKLSLQSQ